MKYALLFLILVLGCAGGGEQARGTEAVTISGKGLYISLFESETPTVAAGEAFTINMEVQNVGGATATSPAVELFRKGAFTLLKTLTNKVTGELSAPDLDYNIPGEAKTASWTLEPPPFSSDFTYTFGASVKYNYETSARAEFTALNRQRLQALEQQGKAPHSSPSEASVGPVDVRIEVPENILIGSTNEKSFPIKVVVENIGGGTVLGTACAKKVGCVDHVELDVKPSGLSRDCRTGNIGPISLTAEGVGYKTCDFKVTSTDKNYEQAFMATAKAKYTYKIEGSTDVTVRGGVTAECTADSGCSGTKSHCLSGRCVECAPGSDCAGGKHCTEYGSCVSCTEDSHCGAGNVCSSNYECVTPGGEATAEEEKTCSDDNSCTDYAECKNEDDELICKCDESKCIPVAVGSGEEAISITLNYGKGFVETIPQGAGDFVFNREKWEAAGEGDDAYKKIKLFITPTNKEAYKMEAGDIQRRDLNVGGRPFWTGEAAVEVNSASTGWEVIYDIGTPTTGTVSVTIDTKTIDGELRRNAIAISDYFEVDLEKPDIKMTFGVVGADKDIAINNIKLTSTEELKGNVIVTIRKIGSAPDTELKSQPTLESKGKVDGKYVWETAISPFSTYVEGTGMSTEWIHLQYSVQDKAGNIVDYNNNDNGGEIKFR